MTRLHILLNLLTLLSSANTGSHSLCSVANFIIGETPFPEFTVLIMLDDIIVSYYDSDAQKTVMRVDRKINDEEQDFCNLIFGALHKEMQARAHLLKQHFNCSNVKPRVRLMKQLDSRSGVARLTCLATGFYPRHINMTLLKDGQGMPEHLVTMGDLLPNGDGTYQMRKTVEISKEELEQKHNYTCTATHLSQDNKMDVYWEMLLTNDRPSPNVTVIMICVLFVCVIAPTAAFVIWKRRHGVSQVSSQTDYSAASSTEEETGDL